eukprot:1572946-Prymnesium_polylepis.1
MRVLLCHPVLCARAAGARAAGARAAVPAGAVGACCCARGAHLGRVAGALEGCVDGPIGQSVERQLDHVADHAHRRRLGPRRAHGTADALERRRRLCVVELVAPRGREGHAVYLGE